MQYTCCVAGGGLYIVRMYLVQVFQDDLVEHGSGDNAARFHHGEGQLDRREVQVRVLPVTEELAPDHVQYDTYHTGKLKTKASKHRRRKAEKKEKKKKLQVC